MDALFRFAAESQRDRAVDAWLRAQRVELRPLLDTWLGKLRGAGPDVRELLHDGCPTLCAGDAAFAYLAAYRAHVNVGFFQGAALRDPARLLEGTGKRGRHVKLRPGHAIDAAALSALIVAAYEDVGARTHEEPPGGRTR